MHGAGALVAGPPEAARRLGLPDRHVMRDNDAILGGGQEKLDRLDEAFLFERSIDIESYDRHAEKLREELTLVRIDRHSGQLDELDVEGILAFAERVLPRATDLWVQASLEQRQRFQQLFFPDGIAFDGNRFIGAGATALTFTWLGVDVRHRPYGLRRDSLHLARRAVALATAVDSRERRLVDLNSASWNRVERWLRVLAALAFTRAWLTVPKPGRRIV